MIKTLGIVINQIKYKDTSIIAKIFTEELGIKSYVINNVRSKKPKYNPSLFYPLNILDMIVYNKKKDGLQYLYEIRNHVYLDNIQRYIEKGIVVIFIADLLDKTLKEGVRYENIFEFIVNSISELNDFDNINSSHFIIRFSILLSKHLGFGINDFNEFDDQIKSININYKLKIPEYNLAKDILNNTKHEYSDKSLNISLLKKIITYYKIHCPAVKNLKSIKIFEELII